MALSNREQKLLGEIEHELAVDDPRLAARLSPQGPRRRLVHFVLAGLLVLGLGVVVTAFSLNRDLVPLGGAGFALSVAGAYIAMWPLSLPVFRHAQRHQGSDSRQQSS